MSDSSNDSRVGYGGSPVSPGGRRRVEAASYRTLADDVGLLLAAKQGVGLLDPDRVWALMRSPAKLARLGRDAGLGVVRTGALLVKQLDQDGFDEVTDPEAVHDTLRAIGLLAAPDDYTVGELGAVLRHMLVADLQRLANDSPTLVAFAEREQRVRVAQASAPRVLVNRFWALRVQWLGMLAAIGDALLRVEHRRLAAAEIRRQWMATFGREIVDLRAQEQRLADLERRLELCRQNPGISRARLEELVGEARSREPADAEVDALQAELEQAVDTVIRRGEPGPLVDLKRYQTEARKMLRETFMLLHPDRWSNAHSAFEGQDGDDEQSGVLTPEQRDELHALWNETMRIRSQELGFDAPGEANVQRSLEVLWDIREKARTILDNAGLECDAMLLIQGDTLEDQVIWLERALGRTERQQAIASAEMQALVDDGEVSAMDAAIKAPAEQQRAIRKDMRGRVEVVRKGADRTEAELEALLMAADEADGPRAGQA